MPLLSMDSPGAISTLLYNMPTKVPSHREPVCSRWHDKSCHSDCCITSSPEQREVGGSCAVPGCGSWCQRWDRENSPCAQPPAPHCGAWLHFGNTWLCLDIMSLIAEVKPLPNVHCLLHFLTDMSIFLNSHENSWGKGQLRYIKPLYRETQWLSLNLLISG